MEKDHLAVSLVMGGARGVILCGVMQYSHDAKLSFGFGELRIIKAVSITYSVIALPFYQSPRNCQNLMRYKNKVIEIFFTIHSFIFWLWILGNRSVNLCASRNSRNFRPLYRLYAFILMHLKHETCWYAPVGGLSYVPMSRHHPTLICGHRGNQRAHYTLSRCPGG